MKLSAFLLLFALVVGATAQQNARMDFLNVFNYAFRVAQTPCPSAVTPLFENPTCYLHGYNDFFDFKMRYSRYFSDVAQGRSTQGRSGYWHTAIVTTGNEPTTAFRSHYRPQSGSQVTVTYLDDLLVLEFSR